MSKVTVRRCRYGDRVAWGVYCSACCDPGLVGLWVGAWAKSSGWATAFTLACWHATLHDRSRCPSCLHEPPLPPPEPVRRGALFYDGNLYAISKNQIRRLGVEDQESAQ